MRTTKPAYNVVAYRTGGWMNAKWHETAATLAGEDTQRRVDEITRQGYKTRTFTLRERNSCGLPVGFCVHADPITGAMKEKRCECA